MLNWEIIREVNQQTHLCCKDYLIPLLALQPASYVLVCAPPSIGGWRYWIHLQAIIISVRSDESMKVFAGLTCA